MFARTERLLLRPGWAEDAPALVAALNDPAVIRNLTRVPSPYTLADATAFLDSEARAPFPAMLIFQRTAGAPRLVGGIGLHRTGRAAAELGYWIARPFWGLGFATEAGRAVIDLARRGLRLPRLAAGHALDNPASGRVLRKLGFRATGDVAPRPSAGRGGTMECALFNLELG